MVSQSSRNPRAEPGFEWRRAWLLGPIGVLLLLVALWLATAADLRARGTVTSAPSRADASSELGEELREEGCATSRDEDKKTLAERRDLTSLPAARRLWKAGERKDVLAAIEDHLAAPSFRAQLLLIAAGDRSGEMKAISERLARSDSLPPEILPIVNAILGSERGASDAR